MASSYNRITRREEVNELFEELGQVLGQKVEALLIGGAVMVVQGLKDSTKDIDVVCRSEADKEALLISAKSLGFKLVGPQSLKRVRAMLGTTNYNCIIRDRRICGGCK